MFNLYSRLSMVSALGIAIWPNFAAAATNGSSANNEEQLSFSGPTNLAGSMIWVVVSLVIVIVLILFVIKWLSQRNRAWGTNQTLRTLGGVALGQNKSLQIIEIADRVYIVGVGEEITLVDKIDDPEQVRAIVGALERKQDNNWPQDTLSLLISKLRNRNKEAGPEPSNEQWNSTSSFQTMLQKKLGQQANHKQQLESLMQESNTNERLMDDEK